MARASAHKKKTAVRSGGKTKTQIQRRIKAPDKPKTPTRKPSPQSKSARAKPPTKAGKKSKSQPKTRASEKRTASKRAAAESSSPRKHIPLFGTPIPAPEKTPRLLSESKATSAALSLLEKGIKLLYQKEFKRARAEFEAIASNYPGEPEIIARAKSYLQICGREEAAHKKQTIANEQLYTLGVMEHNRGNYDGAINYFRQFLEKHPKVDYIYYSLAASQAMNNDVAAAIENLHKAIEISEDNRIYAKNDPDFVALYNQKEFADLVGIRPTSPAESNEA
jgi:tetratricopeptide (TPR) repeat protein